MAEDTEEQAVTRAVQWPLFQVKSKGLDRYKKSSPISALCVMKPTTGSYSANIYRSTLRLRLYLE